MVNGKLGNDKVGNGKLGNGKLGSRKIRRRRSSFVACNSRLYSAICRHHPPQRAVLSQICCFGERKMVLFQILLNGAEPCDAGTTQLCQSGGQQNPLSICVVVHVHNMPK